MKLRTPRLMISALVLLMAVCTVQAQIGTIISSIFQPRPPATAPPVATPTSLPPVLPTPEPTPSATVTPAPSPTPVESTIISTPSATPSTPVATITTPVATPSTSPTPPPRSDANTSTSLSATETAAANAGVERKKSGPDNLPLIFGVIGGSILAAVLGIYIFRKISLAPSGDFKKRMMNNNYDTSSGATLHSNGSGTHLTSSDEKDTLRSNTTASAAAANTSAAAPYYVNDYEFATYPTGTTMPGSVYAGSNAGTLYAQPPPPPNPYAYAHYPPPPPSDYGSAAGTYHSSHPQPRHYGNGY
ncbi:hypothetical protein DFS34DRAFT_501509 [Phlyctochytrium arcticum]|nr:hypothetical protein DFS34DRAFT_501509 [Phlyctochytrium arcticum]